MAPPQDAERDPVGSSVRSRLIELPKEIGPFKILRKIGEGGMGIVFLAQQERPTRTVALKVVHASALSPRTLRRFEQEGEVLARLHHPGIAQVYQLGTYATPQGVLPYLAMEYIDGERIDTFAQQHDLELRERLELAIRVAEAVEHAHSKGVIHRDLKPGNILVTADGQPKVLDFGMARLSDDESRTTTMRTDAGALLGTLNYMSPEQASGDPAAVDKRADVYSLGVVLFELLTGKLPHRLERVALPDAVRVIREEEPSKLSSHDRNLRGDVETIVQKALEKDRTRRYPSAQALADDVRRFLADEPIQARPPSAWYQVSKFAHRNKVLVGGVVAVLLTSLAGAAVATRLYFRERDANQAERDARLRAEAQEKHAETSASFLLSLFEGVTPEVARGEDTTLLRRILENARGRLSTELADQPEVEARIRGTLGRAYRELTLFDDSEAELRRAEELCVALYGTDDRRTLEARKALSDLLVRRGELARAVEEQRAMIERQSQVLGESDRDTLRTKADLGDALMRQGQYREAEIVLREVIARQQELYGENALEVNATRLTLGHTLNFQGKHAEARALLERVFLDYERTQGSDHPSTIGALDALAGTIRDLGDLAEAEAAERDALRRAEKVFGPDNQETFSLLNNLSITLAAQGKHEEAEALLRDCLERRKRVLGPESPETLNTMNNLASQMWDQKRTEEAEALTRECLELAQRVLGENHRETLRAREQLGRMLAFDDQQDSAAAHFAAVVESDRKARSEDDPDRAMNLYNYAATLQNAGREKEAEPLLREALDLVERHHMQSEEFVPAAWNALAKVLEHRGAHDEADPLYQAALEERLRRYGEVHPEVVYSLADYGQALIERGDAEGAEPLLAQLVEIQVQLTSPKAWETASARFLYGTCLSRLGRRAEAESELVTAAEIMAQLTKKPPVEIQADLHHELVDLYSAWDAAEPGQGIAARAERWKTPLPFEKTEEPGAVKQEPAR